MQISRFDAHGFGFHMDPDRSSGHGGDVRLRRGTEAKQFCKPFGRGMVTRQTLQYNASNQLTSVTDSFNRQLSFVYTNGLPQSVTNARRSGGHLWLYGERQLRCSDVTAGYRPRPRPAGRICTRILRSRRRSRESSDENGARYMTWTYDSSGRALTSQRANGADLTTIAYNDTDGSRVT